MAIKLLDYGYLLNRLVGVLFVFAKESHKKITKILRALC